jgi:5-hydroxyisourate hydrolase-like protein (transthyretin family)
MAGITTHVLDTAKGRPAANVRVTLTRDEQTLFEGATDND